MQSEQEKIATLEASGIMVAQNDVSDKVVKTETDSRGLQIFWMTICLALGLTGIIVYRKKRY